MFVMLFDVKWIKIFYTILQGKTFKSSWGIALVVGTILVLINDSGPLFSAKINLVLLLHIFLNYLTPYMVSSVAYLSRGEN
jgi:multisubunit Na+/H+ antiporter MnhG subunit